MSRPVDGASVHVALCLVRLHLPSVGSLKEKRMVLRSLKDSLRQHHNVAVAEVEHQDLWQRAGLGIVTVATNDDGASKVLQQVLDEIERLEPGLVTAHQVEYLR